MSLPAIVFPDDNRVRVNPTRLAPYFWIGQLAMRFPNGVAATGTGTLIDQYYVVTCAHNLFCEKYGGYASTIDFTLALDGGAAPYGAAVEVAGTRVPEEYRTDSPPWPIDVPDVTKYIWDFGIARLKKPLDPSGEDLFPALVPLDDPSLDGAHADIAGYPGDKPPGQMWNGSGRLARPDEHFLYYRISTFPGQSGSAVRLPGGVRATPQLVGIHVAGAQAFGTNFAVRTTPDVVKRITRWMAGSALPRETEEIAAR